MTDAVLLPPSSLGVYSISAQQWRDIETRAKVVVEAAQIADEMTEMIPNYRALLAASRTWKSRIAPGLVTQAILTDSFSSDMVRQYEAIRQQIQGLSDGDPVPAGVTFIVRVKFQAFAQTARERKAAVDVLTPGIHDFADQNEAADAALSRVAAGLGEGWGPIAGPLASLDQSLGAASLGWSSLADQLQALSEDGSTLTTDGLLKADVDGAISSWAALGRQALALSRNAS